MAVWPERWKTFVVLAESTQLRLCSLVCQDGQLEKVPPSVLLDSFFGSVFFRWRSPPCCLVVVPERRALEARRSFWNSVLKCITQFMVVSNSTTATHGVSKAENALHDVFIPNLSTDLSTLDA